jgi:ribosome-associated heat shock protein Hsp15
LSDQRGPAPQARLLYEETPASCAQRERTSLERRAANTLVSTERPSKQQRRLIHRFKRQLAE